VALDSWQATVDTVFRLFSLSASKQGAAGSSSVWSAI
jgi:hypothetical protein